ncbi:unnamed protein product [Staurois parvus]|uniref:Uncharacterized protein n=1 Tax=Staurois parvus TaxID=386267 RepID=A0ABN9ETW7_9NEOB|nr:unnamed protein product [Staurois parvus]
MKMLDQSLQSPFRESGDGNTMLQKSSQRLQTHYRRWSETADILQEMVRDCRHTIGDGQRLQTYYRRWSETADIL